MALPAVLADSSIWIDHIRYRHEELASLLRRGRIVMHPMVIGEVALGSLKRRAAALAELHELPRAPTIPHLEVVAMIERLELFNRGIGFVDAHLLASVRLLPGSRLLTRDGRLREQAERLDLAYVA